MRALRALALMKQKESQDLEARDIYQALIFVKTKFFGAMHSDTLISISDLGSLSTNLHDYSHGEHLHRVALSGREQTLGPCHKDTLSSLSSVADVLKMQGQHGQAEVFYRKASVGREKVLGRDHFLTLISLNNLAITLMHPSQLVEAQEITMRVL